MSFGITHGTRGARSWTWWDLDAGEPLASITLDYDGDGGHTVIHRRCPMLLAAEVVDALGGLRDGGTLAPTHQVIQWPRPGMPISFAPFTEGDPDA